MNVKRNLSSLVSIPQMESDQEGLLVGGFSMLSLAETDTSKPNSKCNGNCSCNTSLTPGSCTGNGNCTCNSGCESNSNCNCDCGTTTNTPTPGGGTPGVPQVGSASNGGFFWGL